MKVRAHELSEAERMETLDVLYTAAASLKGREAMKLFLRDLLTESERIMLGRRIIIAKKLLAGEKHDAIAAELRVGLDTLYRVDRWLNDEIIGYEQALSGMEHEKKNRAFKKEYASSAFFRLKKKYPGHFLLFDVFQKK